MADVEGSRPDRPDPWADLVEEPVTVAGRELRLLRPRDGEALLDEEAFEREEYLPYWTQLWPSALALVKAVGGLPLAGARVVELGCGLGLPSIAAALAGAMVLATDWSPDAVAFTAANASRNGAALETLVCSWAEPGPLLARAPFDLVLASDVLYERRNVAMLLELLLRLTGGDGEVWLADPGRPPAEAFLRAAAATWQLRSVPDPDLGVTVHRLRPARRGCQAAGVADPGQTGTPESSDGIRIQRMG